MRGVHCPSRRTAATRRGVLLPAWGEESCLCTGQGVPPPPGDAWLRRQRCRGVPPPQHSLSARFQASGRPTSPSVAASTKYHPRLHCQLFEYNLLGIGISHLIANNHRSGFGKFHQHLRDTFAPQVVRYVDLMESSIAQSIHKGFEKERWEIKG